MPQAFYQRPELPAYLESLQDAFGALSTERQSGMGMGPIPRSKIAAYVADEMGLDGESAELVCEALSLIDTRYCGYISDKQTRSAKGQDLRDHAEAADPDGVRRVMSRFKGDKTKAKRKP